MCKKINIQFLIIFSVIFSIIFGIAANYQTNKQRMAPKISSYNQLLSKAYNTIKQHEYQIGTFDNIDYFNKRSKEAINTYNPRPLIVGKYTNNKRKRNELRLARFELERFINGYANRIAPENVALMHAAYDCRVKNISINPKMDKKCYEIYIHNMNIASKSVNDFLDRKKQNNQISNELNNHKVKKVSIRKPLINEVHKQKSPNINLNKTSIPVIKQNLKPVNNDKVNQSNTKNKSLNPLRYIHPSLQNRKAVRLKEYKNNVKNSPSNINQTPYGIKPTSNIIIPSEKNINTVSKFKSITNNGQNQNIIDNHKKTNFQQQPILKYKPRLSNKPLNEQSVNQKYDLMPTASIRQIQKKTDKITIRFSSLLNIINTDHRDLELIANYFKKLPDNTIIKVIGHADEGNNSELDFKISLKRAQKIQNILKSYNNKLKFYTHAMGSSEPIKGLSPFNNQNRRTEIIIN